MTGDAASTIETEKNHKFLPYIVWHLNNSLWNQANEDSYKRYFYFLAVETNFTTKN